MAIIQGLLALLLRQASTILNTAFGWATIMLFGKVPQERQTYLSVIAFGSVAWMVVVVGIVFPSVATFLLAFVPLPEWIDDNWVRLAMFAAAVVIPLVVGFVSLLMLDPHDRPQGIGAKAKAVLKGYPYTLGLAITLILMLVFAPNMKIRALSKRWTTQHVPVIVESADYLEIVGEVQRALEAGDVKTTRHQASWMLRFPTKVLTTLAGGAVENLVADKLTMLRSTKGDLEVLLHPSDLAINGREPEAARSHAIIAEHLVFTKAYLTWTKEANEIEDRLEAIWNDARRTAEGTVPLEVVQRLQAVEHDLRCMAISYEEWDILFRMRLLVERGLLQVMAGATEKPTELTEARPEKLGTAAVAASAVTSQGWYMPVAAAISAAIAFTWGVVLRLFGGRSRLSGA